MKAIAPATPRPASRSARARATTLRTAAELFYRHGARAVGMEEIVARSGVAKTTIYRHFPTKDLLIGAFLEAEDREFWEQWEAVVAGRADARDRLAALCDWIGARVVRDGYRGCPQLNMAAEFADPDHPARIVARRHKAEMHRRLAAICQSGGASQPAAAAMQIALLFDGAFASDGRLSAYPAGRLLHDAVDKLMVE